MNDAQTAERRTRSPGIKFLITIGIGFLLAIPLFTSWLLVYDRQTQSQTARQSIVEGWGSAQVVAGPKLVLPYKARVTETVESDGRNVTRTNIVTRELFLAPESVSYDSVLESSKKRRSIYEVVVYDSKLKGQARFRLPDDLDRYGVERDSIDFSRAELRFGLSDARGLAGGNSVSVGGRSVELQPGKGLGETGGSGFFAFVDAGALTDGAMAASFDIRFRGNQSLTLAPHAGRTVWTVRSQWPHPSFTGSFLPDSREVTDNGFTARYDISNLALGSALVATESAQPVQAPSGYDRGSYVMPAPVANPGGPGAGVTVDLIQPVDLYDQVSRATKYGFLVIGFTFVAFLLFDIIAGVRVASVQYILVGAALVLFFVLLLAFAEVIGFAFAYLVASVATIGLITAYAASVLSTWRRAGVVGGLLTALYAAIYVLLSLEAYSLLIGSLLIFAALAGVMYVTRRLDWSAKLPG